MEDSGYGSEYQNVKGLEAGANYTVEAWVSADIGTTATAQIAAYDPGANVATFSAAVTPAPGWTLLKHTVRVSSAALIRIHLFRNAGSGSIFWDDVKVSRD
jgi:hypothetical protein